MLDFIKFNFFQINVNLRKIFLPYCFFLFLCWSGSDWKVYPSRTLFALVHSSKEALLWKRCAPFWPSVSVRWTQGTSGQSVLIVSFDWWFSPAAWQVERQEGQNALYSVLHARGVTHQALLFTQSDGPKQVGLASLWLCSWVRVCWNLRH